MAGGALEGLAILILEDEYLIAMDIEQLCRDAGAARVFIVRSLDDPLLGSDAQPGFQAAILDVRLGATSTLPYAHGLHERGIPFIFSTGYADPSELALDFPSVPVIGKPYAGEALIAALVGAIARSDQRA